MIRGIEIFVDADACPVKDEVYRVAQRHGLRVHVVANAFMQIPTHPLIMRVVVNAGPDVADDWIAERVENGDVAVTSDIPLAERVLKAGGAAIAPNGRPFTMDSIGTAIAQRAIMEQIRSTGVVTSGPKPFDRRDRSQFLQTLDEVINRELRRRRTVGSAPQRHQGHEEKDKTAQPSSDVVAGRQAEER